MDLLWDNITVDKNTRVTPVSCIRITGAESLSDALLHIGIVLCIPLKYVINQQLKIKAVEGLEIRGRLVNEIHVYIPLS